MASLGRKLLLSEKKKTAIQSKSKTFKIKETSLRLRQKLGFEWTALGFSFTGEVAEPLTQWLLVPQGRGACVMKAKHSKAPELQVREDSVHLGAMSFRMRNMHVVAKYSHSQKAPTGLAKQTFTRSDVRLLVITIGIECLSSTVGWALGTHKLWFGDRREMWFSHPVWRSTHPLL